MSEPDHRTILVVDDDEDMLFVIADILALEGYTVQTATNGLEALRVVERAMPDLIVLDMKMPVMDGWRFAKELAARYAVRAPIVVATAAENAQQRAVEIDAEGWIGKPFDMDQLLAVVRSTLRG